MKQIIILIGLLCLISTNSCFAQSNEDLELAEAYYKNNEYEKALLLFDKLYAKQSNDPLFYKKYITVLSSLKKWDKAEKVIKKYIKQSPQQINYCFDLASIYELQGLAEKVDNEYKAIIKKIQPNIVAIKTIATAFSDKRLFNYAVESYATGEKLLNNPGLFAYEKAALLGKTGKTKEMFDALISVLENTPSRIQEIKNTLQDYLDNNQAAEDLQSVLYKKLQKAPNDLLLSDVLIWTFLQRKDFEPAINQAIAIDKRARDEGSQVVKIAQSACDELAFDAAITGYNYVISLGNEGGYFFEAKSKLLKTRKTKLESTNNYTSADLIVLKNDYLNYIAESNPSNPIRLPFYVSTATDLASLEALYFHNYDTAIVIIETLIKNTPLDQNGLNKCKLSLGDYYLMKGEQWESTLLYSQVDKAMPGDAIGELAKFKNAKWSYYFGDFEWAQSQMDILKSSTSDEIANDALDLSIFILENLGSGGDSIANLNAMKLFAKADLLSFQNEPRLASNIFDSLLLFYPGNNLEDNIYFEKAKLLTNEKKYDDAINLLDKILKTWADDVLADDALFTKADLMQLKLLKTAEAKELYTDLLIKYPGSSFSVEARKRIRLLRGDKTAE
jgi:tetratricopeptide (TPR) repeat protein